jgi:hypothetical protein
MGSESFGKKGSTVDTVFDVMRVFQRLGRVQIARLCSGFRRDISVASTACVADIPELMSVGLSCSLINFFTYFLPFLA